MAIAWPTACCSWGGLIASQWIDASRLGGRGAYAYFIYHDSKAKLREQVGVFRYHLIADKAEFVERLPQGWVNDRCTWHIPQPNIAPIKVHNAKSQVDSFLEKNF